MDKKIQIWAKKGDSKEEKILASPSVKDTVLRQIREILETEKKIVEEGKKKSKKRGTEEKKTPSVTKPCKSIREIVSEIPLLSPQKLFSELELAGYKGQEEARRSVCLEAYRHIWRIKQVYEKQIPQDKIPSRTNCLLIGPTGCGKTYIIELLFGQILRLPFVIVDITKYSKTGYVGEYVMTIPGNLVSAADDNLEAAQIGVIAIDEFDKIAGTNSQFAGYDNIKIKDVSGYGVQRELLKLIEGGQVDFRSDMGYFSHKGVIDTKNILFFGIGAFSGIKKFSLPRGMGFMSDLGSTSDDKVAYKLTKTEARDIRNFCSYGFMPELIARFQNIIPFTPLDKKTLKEILYLKLEPIKFEFNNEGFDLEFTPEAEDFIIKQALQRETGARAIESVVIQELESIAFEIYGKHKNGKIVVRCDKDKLVCDIKYGG